MNLKSTLVSIVAVAFLLSCHKQKNDALFELLAADFTGIEFNNQLTESDSLNILTYEYFYNGGGVGIGDINNDGLADIVLGGNMTASKIYLNKGNLKFEDITESAGFEIFGNWARGIAMVDINGDGHLDIYISRAGPDKITGSKLENLLFINQGDLTFKEEAKTYGLNYAGNTTQTAFFDYDRDGDLDAYLVNNVIDYSGPNTIRPIRIDGTAPSTDRLFRNDGNGNFSDVSVSANILVEGYGLGISVLDINQDGWQDIYVSNDYLSNDLLYINQQDGTFKNEIDQYFKHQSYSAMGNDAADIDNDGLVDLVTVDMKPQDHERWKNMFGLMNYDRFLSEKKMGYQPQFMRNTLQHNNGNKPNSNQPFFSEIGRYAGIDATDWSWSALLADLDNDGFRDLMITNGYPKDITNRDFVVYRMAEYQQQKQQLKGQNKKMLQMLKTVTGAHLPNYIFQNNQNLTFTDKSAKWGFYENSYSNGAAYADLDNDGDLDLVINNINQSAFIYKNNTDKNPKLHSLTIKLEGTPQNPSGFGAKVWLYSKRKLQFQEQAPYRGFQSTVDTKLHFGLGQETIIDSLKIIWPDQKSQSISNVKADQILTLKYSDSQFKKDRKTLATTLFSAANQQNSIAYQHQEELYIDFKIQPLLPRLLSQNGPGIAVGDINQDGLEDFFIGNGFNHSGCFFVQEENGQFTKKRLTNSQKFEEDMGNLLFDYDQDGDLDLYIVSGSNEFQSGSSYYQDRLYTNDGKGNFTLDTMALPEMLTSGSVVTVTDFDKDGDLDLFVGGRLDPGQYPNPGTSYLLRNDAGKFVDITISLAPGLKNIGMVTAALWTDFNADGWKDLIIVGEWMPITFYQNNNGKLSNVTNQTNLKNTTGLWNSLTAGDFDEDGDVDYVLGNIGSNMDIRADSKHPITVFAKDYDNNGIMDPVLTKYVGDQQYPMHPRDEMTSQMNFLKKRFIYYKDYAKAKLTDVFTKKELDGARKLTCEITNSIILKNDGKGNFKIQNLPKEAQFGPMYGIVSGDFDLDGHLDLFISGNSYVTEAINGQMDGLYGLFLKGDGAGSFIPITAEKSGILLPGDGKGLSVLTLKNNNRLLLAAQNNGKLESFEIPAAHSIFSYNPKSTDDHYKVFMNNGTVIHNELYFGSGYLSQSSRNIILNKINISKIVVMDNQKKTREIYNMNHK